MHRKSSNVVVSVVAGLLFGTFSAFAVADGVLNVYNWGEYIGEDTMRILKRNSASM